MTRAPLSTKRQDEAFQELGVPLANHAGQFLKKFYFIC